MADPVTFSFSAFATRYPEFVNVPAGQAEGYFEQACVVWKNDGTSPARRVETQRVLLYLLTPHITALYTQSLGDQAPGQPKPASTPVGRISSATQGSVTVQTDLPMGADPSALQAWLAQTKYGLQFWALTGQYRRARPTFGSLQPGGLPVLGYGGLYVVRR